MNDPDMSNDRSPALSVGIVLVPDFTLLALSCFLDTLRLAADDRDRSRPLRCRWQVMSQDGRPVVASCGVEVVPQGRLGDFQGFDYVVVVGGTLYRDHDLDGTYAWLRSAAAAGISLVGICNGSVHLARAGLLDGGRICVSWLHREEIAAEFPRLTTVADELFIWDGDRITCAGGTSVIHLASALVERHLGGGASRKGLRIMLEDKRRDGSAPQPPGDLAIDPDAIGDVRVRKALLAVEARLATRLRAADIAALVDLSPRQLDRRCVAALGRTLGGLIRDMRLQRAHRQLGQGTASLATIATRCGFADAAHFSRAYRTRFGRSPSEARRSGQAARSDTN